MGLKDAAANAAIGAAAVGSFLTSTPSNTPNTDQLSDSQGISQTRNEPSDTDRSSGSQATTSGS